MFAFGYLLGFVGLPRRAAGAAIAVLFRFRNRGNTRRARFWARSEMTLASSRSSIAEHDLIRKPVPTFGIML